ncbi:hypothetical protein BDY24DRAFT_326833, partial [Mrakia frigida]|uniref:uncharacterized protein n=1 Tax=Mrakia frigida TaxID=29902 RepID=UPI003FCBF2A9
FYGVHRLAEVVSPVNVVDSDPRKIILHSSVKLDNLPLSYHLPYHKADHFFKGSTVVIRHRTTSARFSFPRLVHRYLRERDELFRPTGYLFLQQNGLPPTRHRFVRRVRSLLGHSLRSGGATWFTSLGLGYDI